MFSIKSCIAFSCLLMTCSYCDEDLVILKSNGSFVAGRKLYTVVENKPYAAFWRIPYAESPVKSLRFKPPKKHEGWTQGVTYDYTKPYKETCSNGLTEDCLYLSLYMPLTETLQSNSVLVWIHEDSNFHEPDFLIDEEVLVISVSYRTSILGFLNTGDEFAKGNMGAKDVVMALKWVKDNVAVFNGDANKVTIAGSGEAATIVASCLISTAAEDLFNRAVIQSGSVLSPADYREHGFDVLSKLYWRLVGSFDFSREKLYKMLNSATFKELKLLSNDLFDSTEVRDRQRLMNSFGPTLEANNNKAFINKRPLDVYQRKMANNNVEVMIGFTSLESIYKLKGFVKNKKLLKFTNYNFQYLLPFEGRSDEFGSERYNNIAKRVLDFYFANGTISERSLKRYSKYVSDQVIYPIVRQARLHAKSSYRNVYLYRFSFNGLLNIGWEAIGMNYQDATAGDEICYLFKCKSVNNIYRSVEATTERQFIKKIARLWANFVKYGNPTPKTKDDILGVLKWKSLSHNGRLEGLSLREPLRMKILPEEKRMKFWDDLKEEYFENEKESTTDIVRDEL